MPLCASTGPVLGRCCQHRTSTGPVLATNGMFTGKDISFIHSEINNGMLLPYNQLTLKHLQNFGSPKNMSTKLNFCQRKCVNSAKYLTEISLLGSNQLLLSIGSINGLVPIWRQAISWSNDDKTLCCLEGSLDVYELIPVKASIVMSQ